jgi:hypothetical protein
MCDDDKELLIFNTNDFFVDMMALQKIRKITGNGFSTNVHSIVIPSFGAR